MEKYYNNKTKKITRASEIIVFNAIRDNKGKGLKASDLLNFLLTDAIVEKEKIKEEK